MMIRVDDSNRAKEDRPVHHCWHCADLDARHPCAAARWPAAPPRGLAAWRAAAAGTRAAAPPAPAASARPASQEERKNE